MEAVLCKQTTIVLHCVAHYSEPYYFLIAWSIKQSHQSLKIHALIVYALASPGTRAFVTRVKALPRPTAPAPGRWCLGRV